MDRIPDADADADAMPTPSAGIAVRRAAGPLLDPGCPDRRGTRSERQVDSPLRLKGLPDGRSA
jgi:hypothetical protein